MSTLDLSGEWQGMYNYPHSAPPVAFVAAIRDTAGALVGTISEVDDVTGDVLLATLDGSREGLSVRFAKFYDTGDEDFDSVSYDGEVSADGLEIHGDWDIPGVWSGTFIMVRAGGSEAQLARQAEETVR